MLMKNKLVENCYGKINLTLEVIGLRPDGYHEIKSVMQSVSLKDTLHIALSDALSLSGDMEDLSYGEDNLVMKAARLLKERSGYSGGARMELVKGIPVGAGLAGGSTDAAGALRGLNQLWGLGYDDKELMALGAEIGSDIPFCITGGTAFVSGRGEYVRPLSNNAGGNVLIVNPGFSVSTREIYTAYDEMVGKRDHGKSEAMEKALETGERYYPYLINDLELVTTTLYPKVGELIEDLKEITPYVIMSGSGPTVLAFLERPLEDALLAKMKNEYSFLFWGTFIK